VPSHWVEVDGQKIGLWFVQRVTVQDIDLKRFRGKTAFYLESAGEHTLRLTPYGPAVIRWMSARLETDPVDRLDPVSGNLKPAAGNVPVSRWCESAYWAQNRQRLTTSHAVYREPLAQAFAWAFSDRESLLQKAGSVCTPFADDIALYVAGHHLGDQPDGVDRALKTIDHFINLPAWGTTVNDGYGYNGDWPAAMALRSLTMG